MSFGCRQDWSMHRKFRLLKFSFKWFNTNKNIISFDAYINLSIPYPMSYVTANSAKLLPTMKIVYDRTIKLEEVASFL